VQTSPDNIAWLLHTEAARLQHVLVHMTAETQRHAGHADIVRELIDGAAGLLKDSDNLTTADKEWWRDFHDQVDRAARSAAGI
jgi:hypothetical protein